MVGAGLVAMVGAGGLLAAQDERTVFQSGVDLVALTVVATDAKDRFVGGLTAADFSVFEDGVQQDVTYFTATTVPIDLAILLDTSASMTDKIETARQAAIGFASTLKEGDRIMVVDIKDAMKILHPLDEDLDGARAAIERVRAKGGTALYNGLYMTMKEMVKQRRVSGEVRRQALAVLTDGHDTSSLVTFDDVMAVAKQSGIAIYAITLRTPSVESSYGKERPFAQSNFAMKALAQETGGRAFLPAQIGELSGVYGMIADELARQYSMGYTSKNPRRDGSYRRLVVRVNTPGIRTRTRAGYVASPIPSTPVAALR